MKSKEKVINFKNSYFQFNTHQFGGGINIHKKGITIIILIFYIGFHMKN
jgi:hypothetical protein